MRADRLVSILMLLQSRNGMTAPQLAKELEVSVRTIYRDIEALSTAGVPVYAERGRAGGCKLVDGYDTSLTGLTRDEVRALFILGVPQSLDRLGVSRELQSALRKLAVALPKSQRHGEEMVRQRVYLDWEDWTEEARPVPHLQIIYRAVSEDRVLLIAYTQIIGPGTVERFERKVSPYGLVAKGGEWYLVCSCGSRMRVNRVSSIIEAEITDQVFSRPHDFDLPTFWKDWCAERQVNQTPYPVRVRLSPDLATLMLLHADRSIREAITRASSPDAQGWVTTTLTFDRFEGARRSILALGRAIEVLHPEPLRLSVIDYARQITDFYLSTT
jgi:predicted DNA-binding transcriptional regulator YafY